jgi:cytochrome c biogenesis protein
LTKDKKTTLVDRIWDFFSSVRLAIVIFFLIASTSIIGTVLEQQAEDAGTNMKILSGIFGETLAPAVYSIFDAMGFMDMYRSWWFLGLLMLFAANLTICSINRFPSIWRLVKAPVKPLPQAQLNSMPIKEEISLKGKPEAVKEKVLSALKSSGFRFSESGDEDGGRQFCAQSGAWTRLGIYITHFSILLILIGAVIGIVFGYKGFLNIPEGAAYPVAFARTGHITEAEADERELILNAIDKAGGQIQSAASSLGTTEEHLSARMKKLGIEPLGFLIKLEDFEVSFYPNSDMPKEYASSLTVIDGGSEVIKDRWIEVNDPLKYKGYTFYQSSYGMMPNLSGSHAVIKATSPSGLSETVKSGMGNKFTIPGTKMEATLKDFSPALSFDKDGRPFTYSKMMNNPAVRLDISGRGNSYSKWILKRYPDTWRLDDGSILQFVDFWGAQYTGLQVRRDPGVWVVYFGCITMSIGLFIAFFMSHRKLWVRLAPEKNATKITVAGTVNKNRQSFERKIEKIVSLIGEGGK